MAEQRKSSAIEAFLALSEAEREAVFNSFEPGRPRPEGQPLDADERARWQAATASRKRGRPASGEGAAAISVTMERGLLRRTDAYAKRTGLTRARLIAIALENLLPKDKSARSPIGGEKPPKIAAPSTAELLSTRRSRRKTA